MTKIDSLKKEVVVMKDLESLTTMLEQIAARTIVDIRKSILDSRPFFLGVWRIYGILKKLSPPSPGVVHKCLVVAIGIDWGMPGNLLNLVLEEAQKVQKEHDADILLAGKMCHKRFRDNNEHVVHFFSSPKDITLADIQPIYKVVAGYARVIIIYPKFESLSKQVVSKASFSISDAIDKSESEVQASDQQSDSIDVNRFIVEPDAQVISDYLNEAVVGLTVHHYFAEAMLAYSAAQMVAMRSSHDNAKEESRKVRVSYNRARRELIDSKLRELYGSKNIHKEGIKNYDRQN